MKVRAKKGAKCPMEGAPRTYITDSKTVEVPPTAYYRRLVKDGSLVDIEAKANAETKKKTPAKK
jgi:hypothetical protein